MFIVIKNGEKEFYPVLVSEVSLKSSRVGSPCELNFSVLKDDVLDFTEGNAVFLYVEKKCVFKGYVFQKSRDKEDIINVVCYDQLRYLKNKDSFKYENISASTLIKNICAKFNLVCGTIEETGYIIPSRVENNTSLIDIILTALQLTLDNKGGRFCLYDDAGKICLKNVNSMVLDTYVCKDFGTNFSYVSSIDANTFNQIKLQPKDEKKEPYVVNDPVTIKSWGVLQHFENLSEDENIVAKAKNMLNKLNKKTRSLAIENIVGDINARGGCSILVQLDVGESFLNKRFTIEKCVHTFKNGEHTMSLTLIGGDFVA